MAKNEATLDLKFNGVAGRPAVTTARAYIRKRGKKETITAKTVDRSSARTFNLLHLSDAILRYKKGKFPKS